MASQFVTTRCSVRYIDVKTPRLLCVSSPPYLSFRSMPTMLPGIFRPVDNRSRNHKERSFRDSHRNPDNRHSRHTQSSPEGPALHMPLPVSTTTAATSSSAIYGSIRKLQTKFQLKMLLMMSSRHGLWSRG